MHLCSVSSSFANEKDIPFDILQIFQLNLLNTVQLFGSLGLLGVCFVESSCFSSGSKENKAVLPALLKPKVGPWKKKCSSWTSLEIGIHETAGDETYSTNPVQLLLVMLHIQEIHN